MLHTSESQSHLSSFLQQGKHCRVEKMRFSVDVGEGNGSEGGKDEVERAIVCRLKFAS